LNIYDAISYAPHGTDLPPIGTLDLATRRDSGK
jgi:hypothetical protein